MATTDNTTPTPAPGSLTGHPSVTQTCQHGAGTQGVEKVVEGVEGKGITTHTW